VGQDGRRAQAQRYREAARSFGPEVARSMIEMAEKLEAEAAASEARHEPPLRAS
jgi:hypothetical protein